jgi:hypothetical protein
MLIRMMLRNEVKPVAMVPISMLFLVLGLTWPRYLHLASNLGPEVTAVVRGVLFGIAIGMGLLSVGLGVRQGRSAKA